MSEYLEVKTEYRDRMLLIAAIDAVSQRLGFRYQAHPIGQETNLVGWQNDARQQTAEIVIRRHQLNAASNDMGWSRRPDGAYALRISAFDNRSNARRARQIAQAVDLEYQERWIRQQVRANPAFHGVTIERTETEAGAVELRLVNIHV